MGSYLVLIYIEFFQQFASFLAIFVDQYIVLVVSINSTMFSDMHGN